MTEALPAAGHTRPVQVRFACLLTSLLLLCLALLSAACRANQDPESLAIAELVAQGKVFGIEIRNVVAINVAPVTDPDNPVTRDAEQALQFTLDHNYQCRGAQSWRSALGTVYVAKAGGAWKVRYLRSRQDDAEANWLAAWKDCR